MMTVLQITSNRRYLLRRDGTPFFYLADTAWELTHRLTREEIDLYLADRVQKGFTVIQTVVLSELRGFEEPNPYGALPLIDQDPTRPNEAYFTHVDYMIEHAAALGLYVGLLPTWGDKVIDRMWGVGPEIFTTENARVYGEFLGRRYREQPLIWILGGDRPAETPEKVAVWRAMAEGLRAGDGGRHLMTFHPWGKHSSSEAVHHEPWLDFNMIQSGHGERDRRNDLMVQADYHLTPIKPVLDGESRYEHHPVNWKPEENGFFDDYDVRQGLYWGLFAGGCGITYGCHEIWQFYQVGREPMWDASLDWREALQLPASGQAQYARALYESRPFTLLAPTQEVIVDGEAEGMDHPVATRATDGSFLFVYLPTGQSITIDLEQLTGTSITAHWYDPRTGATQGIDTLARQGTHTFLPPSQGRGQDWVLVLDDAACGYPRPSSR
jgi:hypothetical protein